VMICGIPREVAAYCHEKSRQRLVHAKAFVAFDLRSMSGTAILLCSMLHAPSSVRVDARVTETNVCILFRFGLLPIKYSIYYSLHACYLRQQLQRNKITTFRILFYSPFTMESGHSRKTRPSFKMQHQDSTTNPAWT
jgi:hypothetical protein